MSNVSHHITLDSNGPYAELGKNKETLEVVIQPSLGTAQMDEKALSTLQSKVRNALISTVMTESLVAENLCIQIKFNIIEADCDLLSYLINAGSIALTSAGIMQKAIITSASTVNFYCSLNRW